MDFAASDRAELGMVPHIAFDESGPMVLVQLRAWMLLLRVRLCVTQR